MARSTTNRKPASDIATTMSRATALILFAALAAPAHAQWNAGAFLGGQRTQDSTIILERPAAGTDVRLQGVSFEGRNFQGPLYYGFRAGRILGWRLGLEAEFIHAKVYTDPQQQVLFDGTLEGFDVQQRRPLSDALERFSISHGVNFLLGNVVLRSVEWDRDQPPSWMLLARLGAGGTISHPEATIGGVHREAYEFGGAAFQAAVGVEVRIWRGLYGAGEFKYTRTSQDVAVPGGSARAPLRSTHGIFGLSVYF